MRLTAFATNTPARRSRPGTAAPQAGPRRGPHPRRTRTGLRNLPLHEVAQNRPAQPRLTSTNRPDNLRKETTKARGTPPTRSDIRAITVTGH
jgi:hypothetical protein